MIFYDFIHNSFNRYRSTPSSEALDQVGDLRFSGHPTGGGAGGGIVIRPNPAYHHNHSNGGLQPSYSTSNSNNNYYNGIDTEGLYAKVGFIVGCSSPKQVKLRLTMTSRAAERKRTSCQTLNVLGFPCKFNLTWGSPGVRGPQV